jgi:hypothetical protein
MWTNNHLKKLSKYRKLDNKMRMVEELTEELKIKKKNGTPPDKSKL